MKDSVVVWNRSGQRWNLEGGEIERRGTPNNVAETVVEMRVRSISILLGVGIY